jgi:hypothetical protein
MKKNIKQVLPIRQKELIKKALESYQHALNLTMIRHADMGVTINDSINHDVFDLTSLIAYMNYDVTINLPQEVKDKFAFKHGVDFPEYNNKTKLRYPIEQESKWVHIVTGDFSFIDDGVMGRWCHVNNIITIEKHLREDMGQVIDDIENDGHGWVVLEDYDGSIEMNFNPTPKDEREFQVVWLVHTYEPKTEVVGIDYFNVDNGFWGDEYNAVDKLDIDGQTMTDGSIIIIRIK